VLSYNVAGLMRAAPGTSRTYPVEDETLAIADDVRLAAPIAGEVRLQRTGRSILADADLTTALVGHCSRCLTPTVEPIAVTLKEEALPSIDFETGVPLDVSDEPDALRIDEHHELDLTEPIREAISLAEPIAPLCRADCRGLCTECGADLNADPAHAHSDAEVDPRLAALLAWSREDAPGGGRDE
jgi:uncharacterized protein